MTQHGDSGHDDDQLDDAHEMGVIRWDGRERRADADWQRIALLIREAVRAEMTEQLGVNHGDEHKVLAEFLAFWNRTRSNAWDVVVKLVVGMFLIALAGGFIMLVRNYKP